MSEEHHRAVMDRLVDDVFTRHDLTALDDVFHPDYVELDPPPGMAPGREGLRAWLAAWIAAFPDVRWVVEEQADAGDTVWARSTWRGTHTREFLGIPPTGRQVTVSAWTINTFVDGKISQSRILMDTLGLLTQLGAVPAAAP